MVEFALMVPIVFMMIFGMIWGGIMFMEYMHYSNAVRTAARVIAVSDLSTDAKKTKVLQDQKTFLQQAYENEISVRFYKPVVDVKVEKGDAVVEVTLVIPDKTYATLPNVLKALQFPPQIIKTLNYRMKIEKSGTTSSDDSAEGGDG